jgi:hypothetical protein
VVNENVGVDGYSATGGQRGQVLAALRR